MVDLIAGKRVLVEDPRNSKQKILDVVRKKINGSPLEQFPYILD